MRRFLVPGSVVAVAVALLILLALGLSFQGTPKNTLDGEVARGAYPVAPNAHLKLPLLGTRRTMDLASLRGKVVLINMFASWCEDCQLEQGTIEHAETTLARRGGTVLGVSYRDNASADLSYAKRYHLTYPIVSDADGDFAEAYGTAGVPETYIVDRAGRLVAIRRDPVTAAWLDQALAKAEAIS